MMNVPYPPVLGDKRDIDLIIAPEYSAGDLFEVSFIHKLVVRGFQGAGLTSRRIK